MMDSLRSAIERFLSMKSDAYLEAQFRRILDRVKGSPSPLEMPDAEPGASRPPPQVHGQKSDLEKQLLALEKVMGQLMNSIRQSAERLESKH